MKLDITGAASNVTSTVELETCDMTLADTTSAKVYSAARRARIDAKLADIQAWLRCAADDTDVDVESLRDVAFSHPFSALAAS